MNIFLRTGLLASIQSIRTILGGMEILLQTREDKEATLRLDTNEEPDYPTELELENLGKIIGVKNEKEIFADGEQT